VYSIKTKQMASTPNNTYYYYGIPSTSSASPMASSCGCPPDMSLRFSEQNRQYDDLMSAQSAQTSQILAAAQLDAQGVSYRDDLNTNAIKSAVDRNASLNLDAVYRASVDAQKIGSQLNATTERVGSQLGLAVERTGAAAVHASEITGSQLGTSIDRVGAAAVHTSELTGSQLATAIANSNADAISSVNRVGFESVSNMNRSTNEIMAGLRDNSDGVYRLQAALAAQEIASRQFQGEQFERVNNEISSVHIGLAEKAADLGGIVGAETAKVNYNLAEKSGIINNHLSEVKHKVAEDVWRSKHHLAKEIDHKHEWQMRELYHHDRRESEHYEKVRRSAAEHFAQTNLAISKSEALLAQQASNNFGKAQLDLCKTENALALQAANNFANIQLEALKNKEQLAKQMAECCCEIKELVITTSGTTQDVVKANEDARLRDNIRALETQNLLLSVNGGRR
jgi:hypothetical protein